MSFPFRIRILLFALIVLTAGCARQFEPVPPPTPNLLGTYVGTWGDQQTTLVIQGYGAAQPTAGLFLGTMGHQGPQGPLASTMTARVGYVEDRLILSLRLPTENYMDNFEELPLAVQGDTLVGEAKHDYPEGPKGPIKLVRQPAAPR